VNRPFSLDRRPRWVDYAIAVVTVTVATIGTQLLEHWMQPSISLLYFPAIVVPALYGGYGPALFATLLSTLALAFLFIPPTYSFSIGVDDFIRLSVFAAVAMITAWMSSSRKRAEDSRRRSMQELQGAIKTLRHVGSWPVMLDADLTASVATLLSHASEAVGADAAVVVWEEDEEPRLHLSYRAPSRSGADLCGPEELRPLVAPDLEIATFVRSRNPEGTAVMRVSGIEHTQPAPDAIVHPRVLDLLGNRVQLASSWFHTEHLTGRLFLAGVRETSEDLMPALDVIAREVGNSLEQLFVARQLRDLAVREERLRLARDLHDGVLQALTGTRLSLQAIADDNGSGNGVRDRLLAIERAIAVEQRGLRMFIDGLKPSPAAAQPGSFRGRLEEMCARLSAEWNTPVEVRAGADLAAIDEPTRRALQLMIHEAVVNALKHAHPSRVIVGLTDGDGALHVSVSDDGRGFGFRGTMDHEALVRTSTGPASLRERVIALNGRLSVESTHAGSRVAFTLPLR
jgi:signal transduction histidine kinase